MAKPGAQDPRNRTQGNTTPRLAEVREVSVDMIGGEAFERLALLSQTYLPFFYRREFFRSAWDDGS